MSATLTRGLTVLAVALLIGGAYRLNHAIVQENVLGLFPVVRSEKGLVAAAGGVSKHSLASTTDVAKKEGGKGITGYIQDLLKLRKQTVTVEPPVTPEEPELPPEDPPASDDPDESDTLEPVDEPVDEIDEDLPPEEEEFEDYTEDFYEEVPYEDYADEYPLEEYPYEEYTYEEWVPEEATVPYDPGVYVDETVVTPATEPAPATKKPAVKRVLTPVATTKKLPDLYVGEIKPLLTEGQTAIQVNGPVGFNLRIDNAGRAEAASFTTRVRIDTGADGSFDTETLIAPQGPLPLNATQRLVASYVVERATAGRHIAEICVDSTNAIAETIERNNCRRIEFAVAGSAAPQTVAPPGYKAYQSLVNFLSGFLN